MRILVTGATGFVGQRLVPALLEAGYDVRALSRRRSKAVQLLDSGVEVVEGDVLDPESFEDAFEGVDLAYYLVHSLGAGGEYEERDRRAADNVATAASEADVDRVIYLGALGETGDDLSAHLASRREVEAHLAAGDYDVTTFRAAVSVGAGSESFDMVSQMGSRLPVPVLTPKLSVLWIDLVTDTQPSISHPLIEGLKNPVVVTDDTARELLDVERTPFDEAVARAVEGA